MRAVILGLVLAAVAVAGKKVPFKGSLDGSTVPPTTPGLERIEVSGNATHLGRFTAVIETDLRKIRIIGFDPVARMPIATVPGAIVFTAANGDRVYAEGDLTGLLDTAAENFPAFTFENTITGGTGRFDGATGSFTGSGGQTSVPGEDNDLIEATFSGKISSVGSK